MDITNVERKTTFTVENILIIDFIKAINEKDPTIIDSNFTQLDLDNLYVDYEELLNEELSYTEKEIEELKAEINVTINLLRVLSFNPLSVGIINALREMSYKISDKPTEQEVDEIIKIIEERKGYLRYLENTLPAKNKNETNEKINIHKAIAGMSMALGFDLGYEGLTILKFVSYLNVLKDKNKNE